MLILMVMTDFPVPVNNIGKLILTDSNILERNHLEVQ